MGLPAPAGIAAITPPAAGERANAVLSGTFGAVGPSQPIDIVGWANLSVWGSFNTTLTTTAGSTAATVASAGAIAAGCAINGANVPRGTTVQSIIGTAVTLALPSITLGGHLRANGVISALESTTGLLGAAVSGPGIPAGATVAAILTAAVKTPSAQGAPSTRGIVQLSMTATTAQLTTPFSMFTFGLTGNAVTTGADANATFTGTAITLAGTVALERSFDGGQTFLTVSIGLSGTQAVYTNSPAVSALFSEPESGVIYRVNCTAYSTGVINYRLSTTGSAGMTLPTGGNQ